MSSRARQRGAELLSELHDPLYCTDASQRRIADRLCRRSRFRLRPRLRKGSPTLVKRPVCSCPNAHALAPSPRQRVCRVISRARCAGTVSSRLLRPSLRLPHKTLSALASRTARALPTARRLRSIAVAPVEEVGSLPSQLSNLRYRATASMPKAKAPAKRKFLPFDYDALTADVDCRANPHLYRIGAGPSRLGEIDLAR